ncbi:MAG: hypothetical protein AAGI91_09805 [Bacteroidota bacterium]
MSVFRLLLLCLVCGAPGALAQLAAVPHAGYAFGASGPLVGAELNVPVLERGAFALSVRPAVDYVFLDAVDTALVDATASGFLARTGLSARVGAEGLRPFGGVGLALYYVTTGFDCGGDPACDAFQGSFEGADDGLRFGPSASAGVQFPDINVAEAAVGAPFAQLRLALVGEVLLAASVGFAVFL